MGVGLEYTAIILLIIVIVVAIIGSIAFALYKKNKLPLIKSSSPTTLSL